MSFTGRSHQHVFPFAYDRVFNALLTALPQCGFRVKTHDHRIGHVTASTGMSALSWGENLAFSVHSVDETSTAVSIDSTLKVAVNIGGAPKHQANFSRVLSAMADELHRPGLREWNDNTGQYSIVARFVRVDGGFVYLQKQDGQVITVPWERMCEADCKWVYDYNKSNS